MPAATVHIIEDDEAVRESLRLVAEAEGFFVREFETGGTFLRSDPPEERDIVLLDISLPGVDGVHVAAAMRARGDRCTLAVVSGLRESAFRRAVNLIAPDLAFRKPLEISPLLAMLRSKPA